MDKFKRVNFATNVIQGAYTAALVEHHNAPPKDIDDTFSELGENTQAFLLSFQKQVFMLLDVNAEDFAINVDSNLFIFDE